MFYGPEIMGKGNVRDLDEQANKLLREAVDKYLIGQPKPEGRRWSWTSVAREIGVDSSVMSRFSRGLSGLSYGSATSLLALLGKHAGLADDLALLADVVLNNRVSAKLTKSRSVVNPRYANLEQAVRVAAIDNRWSPETVATLRSTMLKSDNDPSVETWVRIGDLFEKEFRGEVEPIVLGPQDDEPLED